MTSVSEKVIWLLVGNSLASLNCPKMLEKSVFSVLSSKQTLDLKAISDFAVALLD